MGLSELEFDARQQYLMHIFDDCHFKSSVALPHLQCHALAPAYIQVDVHQPEASPKLIFLQGLARLKVFSVSC